MVLEPKAEAWSFVISSNWCGPAPAAWRVIVAGTGALVLTRGFAMGICEFRSLPSDLSVGPIEPAQRPVTKWPFVPMMFGWPFHATAGAPLRYVVFLMNVPAHGSLSTAPTVAGSYRFPPMCPSYVERLTQGRRVLDGARYLLDCAHIGVIPGNVAVAFAMQIQVPAGARGRATLSWVLDPPFGFSQAAPVMIGG